MASHSVTKTFSDNNQTLQKAIGYCLRILARKDYSRAEIIYKLEQKAYAQTTIFEVVQYLESKGFVNDQRLADNIVHYYYGDRGKLWIKNKMYDRHLPDDIIHYTLDNLPSELSYLSIEQIASLKRVLQKKYNIETWANIDYTTKGKVFQYLVRKGFSQPIALLNHLTKSN